MPRRRRYSDLPISIPFRLKAIMLPISLLLGLAFAFIGADLILTTLGSVGDALKLPESREPEMRPVAIVVAVLGILMGMSLYSSASKWFSRQIDRHC